MMDDRAIELLHGEVDRANNPNDQRELAALLEASPEARHELDQLRRLAATLRAEPEYEPPPGLREAILGQVQPLAPVIPLRPRRAWAGAALALAATAAGVALILDRGPEFTALDPSALSGTMAPAGDHSASPSLRLDSAPVSGAISLHAGDGRYAIEVTLDAARPVAIIASSSTTPLELEGFVRISGEPAELSAEDGRIRVLHTGRQRYALVLGDGAGAHTAIDFSVYDGDQLVGEARLRWPADTPSQDR
jgi:ferric-dicitrate binding protein FerR (iron transport regulator)